MHRRDGVQVGMTLLSWREHNSMALPRPMGVRCPSETGAIAAPRGAAEGEQGSAGPTTEVRYEPFWRRSAENSNACRCRAFGACGSRDVHPAAAMQLPLVLATGPCLSQVHVLEG